MSRGGGQQSPKRVRVAVATAGCLCLFVALGLALWRTVPIWRQAFGVTLRQPSMSEVAQITGVRVPRGTRLVGSLLVHAGQYRHLYLVLEIERNQLRESPDWLPVDRPQATWDQVLSHTDRLGITNQMDEYCTLPEWWHPDSAATFMASSRVMLTGESVTTLADTSAGEDVRVYVFWTG